MPSKMSSNRVSPTALWKTRLRAAKPTYTPCPATAPVSAFTASRMSIHSDLSPLDFVSRKQVRCDGKTGLHEIVVQRCYIKGHFLKPLQTIQCELRALSHHL